MKTNQLISAIRAKYLCVSIVVAVVETFTVAPVWAESTLHFPDQYPLLMTFRAFDNVKAQGKLFNQSLNELGPYQFVHEIGVNEQRNKKVRMMHQRWPNKIFTIQSAYGGVGNHDNAEVWPGHLLYKTGTLLTQDISATDEIISIGDFGRIAQNRDMIRKLAPFALVIYALDDAGKPDWSHAEQVLLKDIMDGKLIVQRGQWASKAQSFRAKKAVVAAHMLYWTHQWQLNFSLHCPRGGPDNLTAAEWYARKMGQRVFEANADGIEFDVARWTWGAPETNTMDANNDLISDYGYIDGVNSFGLGGRVFFRELRKVLGPNKIIQADSNTAISGVRDWRYLNGVQLEAFPVDNDLDRFSEAFLHLRLWVENAEATPKFSYIYTRLPNRAASGSRFRVNFAAAALVGMPHTHTIPEHDEGSDPETPDLDKEARRKQPKNKLRELVAWDEYHGGESQNWQWLGRPIQAAQQDLSDMNKTDLLAKSEWQWVNSKEYPAKFEQASGSYLATVQSLPNTIVPNQRWFGVHLAPKNKSIPLIAGTEYTLEFEARGHDSWHYAGQDLDHIPRTIMIGGAIRSKKGKALSVLADSKWRNYRISFIADSSMATTPTFGVSEQIGTTELRNIKLYAGGAERWTREFEKGLVLLNMTNDAWSVVAPKGKYKRLKGNQNPGVNTGKVVENEVIIPAHDALFLTKTSAK